MKILKEKKFWFGFIISVICLYLFIRKIYPEQLWLSFQKANYLYLIPAIILLLLSFYFRGLRWQVFLISFGKIPVKILLSPLMIGFMGNSLLPARLGEFIRAYLLTRKEKVSFSASFATIIIERLFDLFAIIIFLVLILSIFPLPMALSDEGFITPARLRKAGYASMLFYIMGIIILFIFRLKNKYCLGKLEQILMLLPLKWKNKILLLAEQFSQGLDILNNFYGLLWAIFYTILVWLSLVLCNYYVMKAFHLDGLPISAPLFVLVIIAFSVALPSAPGYIGIYHKACQIALEAYNVESSLAASVAIIMHATQMIPVVIVGLYYLWKENLSFRQLQNNSNV